MRFKFRQFLRQYNLRVLPISNTDIVPGAVLTRKRGFLYFGHLSAVLVSKPKAFWKDHQHAANIIDGSVQRDFGLKGKASLNQMGVQIGGGLSRAKSVDFSITAVHARTFVNGPGHASMFELIPALKSLKGRSPAKWKMVNNKWIVLETYYASEATVNFKTSGGIDLKSEIEDFGGVRVHGGGGVTWTGKKSFRITQNDTVPFAFRGWRA